MSVTNACEKKVGHPFCVFILYIFNSNEKMKKEKQL